MSLSFIFFSFTSTDKLEELSQKVITLLHAYVEEMPEEKVYLHLDKSHYAAGDDVWFSVYLTAGSPDFPSPLSKTVYVDLLDNNGNLVEQRTIKIQEGHGYGDFKLPYFFPEGLYHIKAYSSWSRGFGEEQVFSQEIEVLEPLNLNFQPEVTFDLVTGEMEGDIKYQGQIRAVDKNLRPLREAKLQFELFTSTHILGEGKLLLNGDGATDLEIHLKESDLQTSVFLKLIFDENENFQIARQFKLPFPQSAIDIQFMPEGGDIIQGFANNVAFRAVYPDGTPAEVEGELRSPDGFVQRFATNANGLGNFSFTPEGKDYRVFLLTQNGEEQLIDFPVIETRGVNLTVDTGNPLLLNMLIQVGEIEDFHEMKEGLLVVHARGRIGYMQKLNLSSGVGGVRVPRDQLAPGINQITVFDNMGNPRAERLVFIDLEDTPELRIEAEKLNFSGKGENTLRLKVDAEAFEGGNYSISVTDASGPYDPNASNIFTYLKFSSELKGRISDRDLYVDGKLDPVSIDLILLTHGWRRFNWEKIFGQEYRNQAHIEEGINIMGTVKPKFSTRKGLEGGTLNVFNKGLEEEFIVAEFSPTGRFIIDALDFRDTTTLVLSAEDGRQKKMLEISVDPPLSRQYKWEDFQPIFRSQSMSASIREYLETAQEKRKADLNFTGEDEILMEEFIVKDKQLVDEDDGITRIYGKGDHILRVADYDDAHQNYTIAHFIRGRMPGVMVVADKGDFLNPEIIVRGQFGREPPLFFIDNQEVDKGWFYAISPMDVLTIEVFRAGGTNARFGSMTQGGVIAIYTKRGGGVYQSEGVLHTKYLGYSTAREFYNPKYDENDRVNKDYRSTLYWNPSIDLSGKEAEISFFNNDVSSSFRVVVQGIDRFGRLSYAEKLIE